ncbi:MAG: hypothetical protein RLZZ262_2520 [Bacteroidota bacterium]
MFRNADAAIMAMQQNGHGIRKKNETDDEEALFNRKATESVGEVLHKMMISTEPNAAA